MERTNSEKEYYRVTSFGLVRTSLEDAKRTQGRWQGPAIINLVDHRTIRKIKMVISGGGPVRMDLDGPAINLTSLSICSVIDAEGDLRLFLAGALQINSVGKYRIKDHNILEFSRSDHATINTTLYDRIYAQYWPGQAAAMATLKAAIGL